MITLVSIIIIILLHQTSNCSFKYYTKITYCQKNPVFYQTIFCCIAASSMTIKSITLVSDWLGQQLPRAYKLYTVNNKRKKIIFIGPRGIINGFEYFVTKMLELFI